MLHERSRLAALLDSLPASYGYDLGGYLAPGRYKDLIDRIASKFGLGWAYVLAVCNGTSSTIGASVVGRLRSSLGRTCAFILATRHREVVAARLRFSSPRVLQEDFLYGWNKFSCVQRMCTWIRFMPARVLGVNCNFGVLTSTDKPPAIRILARFCPSPGLRQLNRMPEYL